MGRYVEPMLPVACRIARRWRETADVFSFELTPPSGAFPFAPGQFNMVYGFGVGEVPVSISGDPARPERLVHTIRTVGAVTRHLGGLQRGASVALRGPFGTAWPLAGAEGKDVVLVAGGLGLAPLRPAVRTLLAHPERYGRITLLSGARAPSELLFVEEVERWRRSGRVDVHLAVDQASRAWKGTVGHVTELIPRAQLRPEQTVALICGPEIMMRFTALDLEKRGVPRDRIHLSMERNMKCAVRFCGHCQLGPHFVCADGPIYPYSRLEPWIRIREL